MSNNKKNKILIVDDVVSNRMLLSVVFSGLYDTAEAGDGAEALRILRSDKDITAVALDIIMPVLDGYSVLSEMRNDKELSDIPVLVITAGGDEKSQVKALELGALDVIVKPFSPTIVLARIKNAIDRRNAQDKAKEKELLEYKLEQQKSELEKSHYDELTGIYNKQWFYHELRRILDENPGKSYVIGRFDIDRFKVFNEIFGSSGGDRLLLEIGKMIQDPKYNLIMSARMDADHFISLFDKEKFNAERAVSNVKKWFDGYPANFDFSVKAGFYEIDDRTSEANVMCDRALLALKSVKGLAGTQIGFYDDSLRRKLLDEQTLLSEMNTAFEEKQFHVWFQPQYDYTDNRMTGAEALVRWIHPVRGIISPGAFIPIMEKNGIITKLDEYVWESCCEHIRKWLDMNGENKPALPPISTNISRTDLLRPDLAEFFGNLTEKYAVPPEMLNLEITESAYMDDSEQLLMTVNKLRSMGFTIEMDDFGVGYSSLNTLKDVPVDILKLDMKFIAGAQQASRGGNILISIIRMARWLDLPIIAEGVETKEQADYLKSIGCRMMQGYYFSRPLPAEKFEPIYLSSGNTAEFADKKVDVSRAEPFWTAANQNALIFNSFLGGAAIIEYHNGNLELLRANDRFFSIINATRREYESWMTHVQDRFDGEYREKLIVKCQEAIRTEDESEIELVNSSLSDGKSIWTKTRIKLLCKSGESAILYFGTENITKQKNSDIEIQKQKALLSSLFDSVPCGIIRYGLKNGNVSPISYNETIWRMLGFCDEASFRRLITQGSPFSMVYQEDIPEFQNKLDIIIKGADGACSEFEHRLCTLGGGTRWSHTVCQKIRIGNDEYIQGVFNDVTERHDTELLKYGKSLLRYFNEVFEVDFNTMTFKPISDGENAKASIHGEIALEKLLSERIMTVASQDERDSLERRFRYIQEYLPESVDDLPPLDYSVINENGERLFHSLMLINTDRGRYLCCITDISALKKAEKLSVEEARLTVENNERKTDEIKNRFVLETLCISVIDYDIPGDIITYCSYRGKNPVNASKAHFYENMSANISFVHPDDREALISVFTRASGTPLKGELIVRIFNNGGYSGNLMNYMSFADENGKMRHLLGMFTELESGEDK